MSIGCNIKRSSSKIKPTCATKRGMIRPFIVLKLCCYDGFCERQSRRWGVDVLQLVQRKWSSLFYRLGLDKTGISLIWAKAMLRMRRYEHCHRICLEHLHWTIFKNTNRYKNFSSKSAGTECRISYLRDHTSTMVVTTILFTGHSQHRYDNSSAIRDSGRLRWKKCRSWDDSRRLPTGNSFASFILK